MLESTRWKILEHLKKARTKHPRLDQHRVGNIGLMALVEEETGECWQAVNDGDAEKLHDELLDVIAVAIRIIEEG